MTKSSVLATAIGAPIGLSVSFTLEVLGAAGAIWGASEVVSLRNPSDPNPWKGFAMVLGGVALFRWILKQRDLPQAKFSQADYGKWGFFQHLDYAFTNPMPAIRKEFESSESSPLIGRNSPSAAV